MRLHRNRKALSPIFATLILIAIAVIAGVVVYMFTSGFLAGMTNPAGAGQERITIQSASANYINSSATGVYVLTQSTGGPLPSTTGLSIIVKNISGTIVTTANNVTVSPPWASGTLVNASATLTSALNAGSYTLTLVTPAGGSFVSPSFTYTPPPPP